MAIPKCSPRERNFARLIAEGTGPIDAYRKVFKKKVEPNTKEYQRARTLAKSSRVQVKIEEYKEKLERNQKVESLVRHTSPDWDDMYQFAFDRLLHIRDDPETDARTRFKAIQTLEQIQDPTQDTNLIYRYVDVAWNGMTAHCPCCHADFPLWKVKNKQLDKWRKEQDKDAPQLSEEIERRLYLIGRGEKRKSPKNHAGQMKILSAPERHIVASGSARAGKSACLAMLGFMYIMIPGVEVWILARIYDDAQSEMEYIERFLATAFYPVSKYMYDFTFDKKTGEASVTTRWGSVLKIKSGKSKGSITGRELEAILVAEPGWVDAELFEEVRARMSSRLGRIFAFGTAKGFGGFLGRMMRMTNRDMRTGKRLPPGARLIKNGALWVNSLYSCTMSPTENPEYVKAELDAAKSELTEAEFASEFEGRMMADANLKFPYITDKLLVQIPKEDLRESVFCLGIDQGERNFGAALIAWDGEIIRVCYDFFDRTEKTIKANMIELNNMMPAVIRVAGGLEENWKLTIFDVDPKVNYQLLELTNEGRPWKTEVAFRPKGNADYNWREETCLWLNEMAKAGRIIFQAGICDLIHEDYKEALIKPVSRDTDNMPSKNKLWVMPDQSYRRDHVADALLMALWTIYSNNLIKHAELTKPHSVLEEQKRAFEFRRMLEEKKELGMKPSHEDRLFEEIFGRGRGYDTFIPLGGAGYFSDES